MGIKEPRLEASGWFTRSFASTTGVMLGLSLFLVGVPALFCAGCMVIGVMGSTAAARIEREERIREDLLRAAKEKHLEKKKADEQKESRRIQLANEAAERRTAAREARMRTWTLADGNTFRGIFVELKKGVYHFDTDEGALEVAAKDLSNDDRTWVIEHVNASR